MPSGIYERTKLGNLNISKAKKSYWARMSKEETLKHLKSWMIAGQQAFWTLEARQKIGRVCSERFAKMTKEEIANQLKSNVQAMFKANKERRAKMTKEERHQATEKLREAGNKATREKCNNETKKERLIRLKLWIEAGQKAVQKWWDNATKEEKRERTRLAIVASQKANPSSIEKMIWKELDELGIKYETQVPICGGMFILDICFLLIKVIIECNGTFWHNYEVFPEKKIRDDAVDKWAARNGYQVIWLWESEIIRDAKQALEDGLNRIKLEV